MSGLTGNKWYARGDSNPKPLPCQPAEDKKRGVLIVEVAWRTRRIIT
jgi:hypothetical protein